MSAQPESISQRLAARLARPVSEADRIRARQHLLDWCACAIAGARESGAAEPQLLALREGRGRCTVISAVSNGFTGSIGLGPQAAALANGPLGAILEMDDVDKRALVHPGPVVIPAVLAAVQSAGIDDGRAFLDAIVRGYEAIIRVGRAAGAELNTYFHKTGTCGVFGAAAGAGSVLGLSIEQCAWALGNAGQQAAGLWQVRHENVFTKSFHDGRTAANGLAAAFLALDGYAGPLQIFEGPQGFFAALCAGADPRAIVSDESEPWAIHEVSFKPHASCRHTHPAIDAVLALREQCASNDFVGMRVEVFRDAMTFCNRPSPQTSIEAKFSVQHAAAVAWLHGDVSLPRFALDALDQPDIAAVRERVQLREGPKLTARYPNRFGASVTLITRNGEVTQEIPDALGDPENPLSEADLLSKARSLFTAGGLTESAAERLIDVCSRMGNGATVPNLGAALAAEHT